MDRIWKISWIWLDFTWHVFSSASTALKHPWPTSLYAAQQVQQPWHLGCNSEPGICCQMRMIKNKQEKTKLKHLNHSLTWMSGQAAKLWKLQANRKASSLPAHSKKHLEDVLEARAGTRRCQNIPNLNVTLHRSAKVGTHTHTKKIWVGLCYAGKWSKVYSVRQPFTRYAIIDAMWWGIFDLSLWTDAIKHTVFAFNTSNAQGLQFVSFVVIAQDVELAACVSMHYVA